jgi:hypothetical protein
VVAQRGGIDYPRGDWINSPRDTVMMNSRIPAIEVYSAWPGGAFSWRRARHLEAVAPSWGSTWPNCHGNASRFLVDSIRARLVGCACVPILRRASIQFSGCKTVITCNTCQAQFATLGDFDAHSHDYVMTTIYGDDWAATSSSWTLRGEVIA